MPTITFTLPISGTVITAGLHSANYSALQTLLNGGLDNANITAGAAIDLSKLAAVAWTSYSPAWTSSGVAPVLNNGTLVGKYMQVGKTVVGRIVWTAGSTTTFGTGSYFFSTPNTANVGGFTPVGNMTVQDASPSNLYMLPAYLQSNTTISASTAAAPGIQVGATVPITFAVSDLITITFTYEAA